jgi:hypothetical protein
LGQFSKNYRTFNPKKLSISSQKYGFGIPDPGVKEAPDPGSGSATLKHYIVLYYHNKDQRNYSGKQKSWKKLKKRQRDSKFNGLIIIDRPFLFLYICTLFSTFFIGSLTSKNPPII